MRTNRYVVAAVSAAAIFAGVAAEPSRAQESATTAPTTQSSPSAGGATGTWTWQQQGRGGNTQDVTLKLKQDGDKVTGTITGMGGQESEIQDGTFKDGQLSFKVTREFGGQQMVITYTGTIEGGTLKGKSEQVTRREFEGKRSQS